MKIVSFVLTLVLIFGIVPDCTFAMENTRADNHNMLLALGIADEGDVLSQSGSVVTRAQFVKYALRTAGVVNPDLAEALPFADVSSTHSEYSYIASAVKLGYISGSNGFFLPDDAISMYAASKIAVHVLEYQLLAESSGGYPTGYMKYADKLKIFDDCPIADNEALTSDEVCRILVNMLHADVLETTAVGDDGNSYMPYSNLLERRHHVYTGEGIVTASAYSSVSTPDALGDTNLLEIDWELYSLNGIKSAHTYIGQQVRFYYKKISSARRELVYICPGENNLVLTLGGKDIEKISTSEIKYFENEKETSIRLSKAFSLIYNGNLQAVTSGNISSFINENTENLTVISNDGDKTADVIIAESYRTVFVGGISAKTYSVADSLGGASLILDPEDKFYDVFIEKEGKEISFSDIKVNDVISYYESKSDVKTLKKLIVSDKSVKGQVTEKMSTENKISIDGVFCEASDYMYSTIDLGMSGVFYLDAFGKIVNCRTDELDVVYGYITGIGKKSPMGGYEVKIFTENNRWVELPLAKKLRSNGKSVADKDLFDSLGGEAMENQLVAYLVNSNREVIRLDVASSFEKNSQEEKEAIQKQTFRHSGSYPSIAYRADGPSFDDKFYLDDTIIFSVPLRDAKDYTYSDDKFEILSTSSLINSGLYKVDVFDVNEFGRAKVCVIPYREKSVGSTEQIMIVDHVTEAVNNEGTVVKAIRGLYSGIEAKLLVAENISDTHLENVSKLSKGDVIRFTLNKDGYAEAISGTKLIDYAKDGDNVKKIIGASYDIGAFIAGEVKAVSQAEGIIGVDCGYSGGDNAYHRLGSLKAVYIFNRAQNTMEAAGISDISEGDYVYMTSRYLRAGIIIVVK